MTQTRETTTGQESANGSVPVLWVNQNGRVACQRHGGYMLAATVSAAATVRTDLDEWARIDPARLAAAGVSAAGFACETCGAVLHPL